MEHDRHITQMTKMSSPGTQARCRSLPPTNSSVIKVSTNDSPCSVTIKRRNRSKNNATTGKDGKASSSASGAHPIVPSPSVEERLADLGIGVKRRTSSIGLANSGVVEGSDLGSLSARSSVTTGSPRSFGPLTGRSDGETSRRGDFTVWNMNSTDMNERKSARLISAISRRISEISTSVDHYDKGVRNVNETLQEAYRKSVQDQIKSRQASYTLLKSRNSSPRLIDSPDAVLLKCQESLNEGNLKVGTSGSGPTAAVVVGGNDTLEGIQVERAAPRKIFGLDATPFLRSSSSEASSTDDELFVLDKPSSPDESSSEEEGVATMRISIKAHKPTKVETLKRFEENLKAKAAAKQKQSTSKNRASRSTQKQKNRRRKGKKEEVPRSLSPIMPSLPDKQFQTMLKRREQLANRHLNSMKNGLAQLNHKVELDKKKADLIQHNYKGRPFSLSRTERRLDGNSLFVFWNNVINSN